MLLELLLWADAYVTHTNTGLLPTLLEDSSPTVQPVNDEVQSHQQHGRVPEDADNGYDWQYGSNSNSTDLERHESFYCCVQAMCYVVCFHGTSILFRHKDDPVLRRRWERVLSASIVPLRYCLQSVREEFLRAAYRSDLLTEACWELMPHDLLTSGLSTSQGIQHNIPLRIGGGINPLDSFFPFDPCLLQRVHATIADDYRCWNGVPGLDVGNGYVDMPVAGVGTGASASIWDESYSYAIADLDSATEDTGTTSDFDSVMSLSTSFSSAAFSVSSDAYAKDTSQSVGSSYGAEYAGVTGVTPTESFVSSGSEAGSWEGSKDKVNMNITPVQTVQLQGNKLAMPIRRPRQFSISSVGSW